MREYKLNFPNGNVQTYSSSQELLNAAKLLNGKAQLIPGGAPGNYVFIPNK